MGVPRPVCVRRSFCSLRSIASFRDRSAAVANRWLRLIRQTCAQTRHLNPLGQASTPAASATWAAETLEVAKRILHPGRGKIVLDHLRDRLEHLEVVALVAL